ncbi:type III restriction enzyme [Mucilaginibacter frigoritolerans]|uniref:Type III restriction enzyme n=1 Tax=Mucilaginibacter frigoritolerans TaxID=652788 RepID=A0A562U973_9SPHI|nr:DEAD/DEAH box helicase family protein [Mucilaginibacter frigoritolerans]TWJ02373.1 type III restriction enzyme [Mucilaginibacter frigoritolerans]
MELKSYQQQVIDDLAIFLNYIQEEKDIRAAFEEFWLKHPRTPIRPFPGTAIEPYKNNVPKAPNVCVKVPTAGGKTFIACNAIKTIFDAFSVAKDKAVVWLVPSITILDQTLTNLKDPTHPYRQKINSHFGNRVEVFDKQALLQGSGFNISSVKEQLNIFVLSFDSLRARNKEDRKVYQDNSNLQSFESMLGEDEDISLMNVIQKLNPVVIVDESHNAESELSVEMLKNLNPSFILDLTATPRKNSNIISFVDAIELKRNNMVKLPVIVYNHHDKTEVINSALQLQKKLEIQAKEEQKKGGRYIRPIVLFQAQPKNADDNTTFEKLKAKLIELKIPEEQIKIKTANINEIKNEDLMSPTCKVKYIITVNALKEGWDCPFAYILASLADKSSPVDVEQILGRVLRQPYVHQHSFPLLNLSYVLTASSKFLETLDSIVKGLNKSGFSSKDYKLAETIDQSKSTASTVDPLSQLLLNIAPPAVTAEDEGDTLADIDISRIIPVTDEEINNDSVKQIEETALEQTASFNQMVSEIESNPLANFIPTEIQGLVNTYTMKDIFKEEASKLEIPQFFIKKAIGEIFAAEEMLLEKEDLLAGFPLGKADTNINFNNVASELYKVDLDETKKDYTPSFVRLDGEVRERVMTYILDPARKDSRIKNLTKRIIDLLGRMDPIPQREIEKFVSKVLEDFTDEQFSDFASHEYSYKDKIKEKIRTLSDAYAEKQFHTFIDIDRTYVKSSFKLPLEISPGFTSKDIGKSLYDKEGDMNGFEERVINEIANLTNILFWTRNIERKGFRLNGFVNHYPDFIIQTKSGKTIILETKGDDRDNSDSEAKLRLGNAWVQKAGSNYKYFMVFDKREVDGAHRLDEFLLKIKEL